MPQNLRDKEITSMKKLAIVFLLVLLTPAISVAASNQYREGDLYAVFNLTKYNDIRVLDSNGFSVGSRNFATFQLGYDLSKYLALEGHFGTTSDFEDDWTDTTGPTDYHTTLRTTYASVVARGNLRFDKTTLFGFVGMSYLDQHGRVKATGAVTGTASVDESRPGATYGLGIDLYGNKTTAITLKWAKVFRATKEDDDDLDATMIGITHYLED
jgi:hypothetical protein